MNTVPALAFPLPAICFSFNTYAIYYLFTCSHLLLICISAGMHTGPGSVHATTLHAVSVYTLYSVYTFVFLRSLLSEACLILLL